MLRTAQVLALCGIVVVVAAVFFGTAVWFGVGGALVIVALIISKGRIVNREPPQIADLLSDDPE